MEIDRSGLEVLSRDECLGLLAGASLGRIAVTSDALPALFPVTFGVQHERIVFAVAPGTTLDAATRGAVVAFEADDLAVDLGSGWSVMVRGVADDLDAARSGALAVPLPSWRTRMAPRWVGISTELVSGRRILGRSPLGGRAPSTDGAPPVRRPVPGDPAPQGAIGPRVAPCTR